MLRPRVFRIAIPPIEILNLLELSFALITKINYDRRSSVNYNRALIRSRFFVIDYIIANYYQSSRVDHVIFNLNSFYDEASNSIIIHARDARSSARSDRLRWSAGRISARRLAHSRDPACSLRRKTAAKMWTGGGERFLKFHSRLRQMPAISNGKGKAGESREKEGKGKRVRGRERCERR